MKLLRFAVPTLLALSSALAADVFPGLQKVMTGAEWKRAGLDKLTPDQLGVIDAALIRHYGQAVQSAAALPPPVASATPSAGATPAEAAAARSRFWEKFGLGRAATTPDWRTLPPMTAKVTGWRGANGFVLDNGQIWEGVESIPYDLPGNTVTIEARPLESYALRMGEDTVYVRVRRVK